MLEDANESPALARTPIDYREAARVQECLVARRQAGDIPDTLWLLEHAPTVTCGVAGGRSHLRVDPEELARRGYAFLPTRRGGDITCHEPGQLVGYPIVLLGGVGEARDLHLYLRSLEEAMVRLLGDFGLVGRRVEGRTGVWLAASERRSDRKIAAMGVRCARWVTSHGFALNVENSLEGFRYIVPCGISDAEVTSLAREIGSDALPAWGALASRLHGLLEETLGRPLRLLRGAEACR